MRGSQDSGSEPVFSRQSYLNDRIPPSSPIRHLWALKGQERPSRHTGPSDFRTLSTCSRCPVRRSLPDPGPHQPSVPAASCSELRAGGKVRSCCTLGAGPMQTECMTSPTGHRYFKECPSQGQGLTQRTNPGVVLSQLGGATERKRMGWSQRGWSCGIITQNSPSTPHLRHSARGTVHTPLHSTTPLGNQDSPSLL